MRGKGRRKQVPLLLSSFFFKISVFRREGFRSELIVSRWYSITSLFPTISTPCKNDPSFFILGNLIFPFSFCLFVFTWFKKVEKVDNIIFLNPVREYIVVFLSSLRFSSPPNTGLNINFQIFSWLSVSR